MAAPGRLWPAGPLRPGLERGDLRRPDRSPQDEDTPVRPVNPYGAAKAFAHHAVGVYRHRGLHAVSLILYNHESPRRPEHFVTRKITAGVAAIADGRAERLTLGNLAATRDWGWAPDYVGARWCWPPAPTSPATTS